MPFGAVAAPGPFRREAVAMYGARPPASVLDDDPTSVARVDLTQIGVFAGIDRLRIVVGPVPERDRGAAWMREQVEARVPPDGQTKSGRVGREGAIEPLPGVADRRELIEKAVGEPIRSRRQPARTRDA